MAAGAVRVCFFALVAAGSFGGDVELSFAQTRPALSANEPANVSPRKENVPRKEAGRSENRYTVGLVAGAPHSTEFAAAQEMATTLASGQETGPRGGVALRVMPIPGNGGSDNILDVLTLAGADMAIAPVVLVNRLRDARTFGDIRNKLVYITPFFTQEFHLLVRPEIRSLTDLAGKTVNLGEEGSASAVLGREVFNSLGVNISERNLGLDAALDGMRTGQIFATLLLSGKPVNFLAHYPQSDGIRVLPIPYPPALERDYLPSVFRHEDYPNIIAEGESVETIAIQSALFAYNWPVRNERFRLLELFVRTFFSRFHDFLGNGHHPQWNEMNLSARLPEWQRFPPAERWLQRQSGAAPSSAVDPFIEEKSTGKLPDREAKASKEATQLKQASESSAAELQKSLQQERDRAAQLEQNLAAARHDMETQTMLAAKAAEEVLRGKQAAEATTAELRRSLQQERDSAAALASELATVRRDFKTKMALSNKASDEAAQLKQAAEDRSGASAASSGKKRVLKTTRHDEKYRDKVGARLGVAGIGGVGGLNSANVGAAYASLEPAEQRRLLRRCATVLKRPSQHNHETLAVCRVVAAR
ncbi:hypothetical protein JIR23_27915 [Bradyrhizobium diazoefficiens]|nr:hypothetical protein JIR23_27915 [Bradyrhizobium diazoefficiens]